MSDEPKKVKLTKEQSERKRAYRLALSSVRLELDRLRSGPAIEKRLESLARLQASALDALETATAQKEHGDPDA